MVVSLNSRLESNKEEKKFTGLAENHGAKLHERDPRNLSGQVAEGLGIRVKGSGSRVEGETSSSS